MLEPWQAGWVPQTSSWLPWAPASFLTATGNSHGCKGHWPQASEWPCLSAQQVTSLRGGGPRAPPSFSPDAGSLVLRSLPALARAAPSPPLAGCTERSRTLARLQTLGTQGSGDQGAACERGCTQGKGPFRVAQEAGALQGSGCGHTSASGPQEGARRPRHTAREAKGCVGPPRRWGLCSTARRSVCCHLQLRFSTENSTWHTVGGPRTPGYCYGFFVPPAVTWLWALPWAPNTQAPPSRSLPGVPSLCPGPAQLFPMDVFSKTWQQVSYRLESQSCGECKRYFELSAAEGHESKGCVYWRSSPRYQTTTFALFTLIGNAKI